MYDLRKTTGKRWIYFDDKKQTAFYRGFVSFCYVEEILIFYIYVAGQDISAKEHCVPLIPLVEP
jgi:hypothetical protein